VNASQLLEELQRRAVVLWIEGEGEHAGLRFKAPPGVLKPPILAAMKASKGELLLILKAQAAPVAPVEVEPEPQVLGAPPSPVEAKPEPEPSEEHAARLRLAHEIGGVLEALPGAKRLRSGDWRFEGEVWGRDQAVLLAAQRRGATSGGYPLSFHAAQVLEAPAQAVASCCKSP